MAEAVGAAGETSLVRPRADLEELTLSLLGLSKPAAAAADSTGDDDEKLKVPFRIQFCWEPPLLRYFDAARTHVPRDFCCRPSSNVWSPRSKA